MASILVVDPDTPDRNAVVSELRELGHDVSESTSAGRALQVLRSRRPDLLLLEWKLADLAGIEVLADIRRSEEIAPAAYASTT